MARRPERRVGLQHGRTSPEVIAFAQRIHDSGAAIFHDSQMVGLLGLGGALIQMATGVLISPVKN